MKKKLQLLSLSCLLLASCLQSVQNDQKSNMIEHDIDIASQQIGHQVEVIEKSGKIPPRGKMFTHTALLFARNVIK